MNIVEDRRGGRKLHGKTEAFNEMQESSTALITSVDESLLNLGGRNSKLYN